MEGREYNGARSLAHSAVLSEDLLGSNPTGIAPHCVHTHAVALARKRSHPSHVRRSKFRIECGRLCCCALESGGLRVRVLQLGRIGRISERCNRELQGQVHSRASTLSRHGRHRYIHRHTLAQSNHALRHAHAYARSHTSTRTQATGVRCPGRYNRPRPRQVASSLSE